MRHFVITTALLFPATGAAQAPAELEKQIREAQAQIEAIRGLKFKGPVKASVIPRPAGAAAGVQGYYSTKDKALYVYDDIRDNYQRGTLIHELVHALQDQHFGLDKLHQTTFGSDAEMARAALIEGDATYTMIEVLKKDQPKVAAMLDVPLGKAKNLDNAFLYAQGARYVAALKQRGGWPAVNFAYRFPPRTTAAILALGGGSTIDLGPGKTIGAFPTLKRLAAAVPTPQAVEAVQGWKADRVVEDGGATTWTVAFTTPDEAKRFHTALTMQRRAADKTLTAKGDGVWHTDKGAVVAVLHRGDRVLAIDAPDVKAFRTALDRAEGPLQLTVHCRATKKTISFGDFIERLLEADLVCVGETHDSEPHHRAQLHIIKGLFARDERLGVGLEMFQRPYQHAIDKHFRGETDEAAFLKESEYKERWGYDWALYRPIVDFCRRNAVPVAALNVSTELRRRVSKVGHEGLTDEEKKQLGPIDFHVKAHRDHWYERLSAMHGNTKATPEQKERGYQVMTVWDEYMADSAAKFQKERELRRLVVLAGSGHIERGFGIPDRAARRTGGRAVTVGITTGTDPRAGAEMTTDYLVVVR